MAAVKYKDAGGVWRTIFTYSVTEGPPITAPEDIGAAPLVHQHTKADITNFPTSLPASDVSAWAKAETKPSYTHTEVGAAAASHEHDYAEASHTHGNITNDGKVGTTEGKVLMTSTGGTVIATDMPSTSAPLDSYPVGAIYQSTVSTSPATLFGGTWAAIGAGRFLVAAGTGYAAGATGGAASVTLTVGNLPKAAPKNLYVQPYGGISPVGGGNRVNLMISNESYGPYTTAVKGTLGDGTAHENRPPYYAVYMWRRTA